MGNDLYVSVTDTTAAPFLSPSPLSSLPFAASRGHLALVQRLLDVGCPVDIQDDYGSTPLYRAVGFRHNAVVQLLLARGADIRRVNKDGNNIIHNRCGSSGTVNGNHR